MSYVAVDKDLGMDCDFEARGETKEEVIQKMFEHAKEAHADIFVSLSEKEQEEMSAKLEEIIREE